MTVKRYIRKGIPLEHRARVWMGVSGAQARMERNPGYYHRLLQGERNDSLEEAIRTDMNRTFPDNVKFRKSADPCLQKTLYNVLLAYGHHNRGVGYCQGMNFIAGYLILITKNEEESFWLLDALVGRILPDYYSPEMLGLKTDQEVLGELVRTKLPAVAALMDGHGVLWTLVVSRWFICLFVDILPVETVLRIWDCLFNEGSKIIFRVALTLIKQHQAFILEATSFADICEKFKEITKGSFVTECHTFMQVSVWVCSACALLCCSTCLAGEVTVLALPSCPPGKAPVPAFPLGLCLSWGPSPCTVSSPFQAHPLLEPKACRQMRGGHLPGVQWLLPLLLCHQPWSGLPQGGQGPVPMGRPIGVVQVHRDGSIKGTSTHLV
ncbi:growth hormone regulated TBC protein 1 [Phyllostomus discolor]|uniref:Growth hormone regulated TBC protein 1 n=1 Tax=Phyllostomus discolor TaxID=89673 RepID=A0A834DNC5_9CHIR|nr:growth hormone regulated TBC protein 1 [Phyllostomus discolor]